MLTINLWTDAGLWNSATGSIVNFLYATNQQPPQFAHGHHSQIQ